VWLEEAAQQVPWTNGKNGKVRNDDSGSASPVVSSSQDFDKDTVLAPQDSRQGARRLLSMLCRTMRDESLWALLSELDVERKAEEQTLGLHRFVESCSGLLSNLLTVFFAHAVDMLPRSDGRMHRVSGPPRQPSRLSTCYRLFVCCASF
jgi:hypothetical protein